MTQSSSVRTTAALVLAICLGASIMLLWQIDHLHPTATIDQVLYLPSPNVIKSMSLGYDGLMADVYWTRAVQYYGKIHHAGGGKYELLWPLLNITAHLDPRLRQTYEYGSTFLAVKPPNGAGLPDKAVELVKYGISQNPDEWRLYYDLGFIYYDLNDYRDAANTFLAGSKLPHTQPFLGVLAARMAEHGGELETARFLWQTTYETTNDKYIRANALTHLRALKADDDVVHLQELVKAYQQRFGDTPASFAQVAQAGFLRGIPVDPTGHPYKLETGQVLVSDPDALPFLEKGLPPGYVPKDQLKDSPSN